MTYYKACSHLDSDCWNLQFVHRANCEGWQIFFRLREPSRQRLDVNPDTGLPGGSHFWRPAGSYSELARIPAMQGADIEPECRIITGYLSTRVALKW